MASQRSFVSGTGADVGTCPPTAPCRSFGYAISHTNPGGEVIVLDSAGYGAVAITQSVSIIAPPEIYGGISVFSGDGVTVNAPGATVVLRGLSINGQGGNRGVSLLAAARLRVEGCIVSGMQIAGISHTATGTELIVQDTVVRDNVGSGVYLFADVGSVVLEHVRGEHNGGDGVSVSPTVGSLGALATITDSSLIHNEGNGIGADSVSGATITLLVDRSVVANNGQNGVRATAAAGGSGVVTVSRGAISDNGGHGVLMQGGLQGAVTENVTKRNSGNGVFLSATLPAQSKIVLSHNVFEGDLGGSMVADGSGTFAIVSANTGSVGIAVTDFVCQNSASFATFADNAVNTISGCPPSKFGYW